MTELLLAELEAPSRLDSAESAMTAGHPPTRRRSWRDGLLRPAVGLLSIFALIAIVALALVLFQGGFISSVPVTVVSQRAGLVMYPDARVKLRGVEVGRVSSIEERADGTAAIHLAMDPKQLDLIPGNARVAVVASTASERSSLSWSNRRFRRRSEDAGRTGDRGRTRDRGSQQRVRSTQHGSVDSGARKTQRNAGRPLLRDERPR